MSSCMWISIWTEPSPTFGWEPSSDRVGQGGDESEENDSFAVWERREGGMAERQRQEASASSTKTPITHHGSESRIVPALTLGCYNKTMQGHNVPIHHQHSHGCWETLVPPPPQPLLSQCEIERPTLFRWFTILWLNIRWKRRCDSCWLAVVVDIVFSPSHFVSLPASYRSSPFFHVCSVCAAGSPHVGRTFFQKNLPRLLRGFHNNTLKSIHPYF